MPGLSTKLSLRWTSSGSSIGVLSHRFTFTPTSSALTRKSRRCRTGIPYMKCARLLNFYLLGIKVRMLIRVCDTHRDAVWWLRVQNYSGSLWWVPCNKYAQFSKPHPSITKLDDDVLHLLTMNQFLQNSPKMSSKIFSKNPQEHHKIQFSLRRFIRS